MCVSGTARGTVVRLRDCDRGNRYQHVRVKGNSTKSTRAGQSGKRSVVIGKARTFAGQNTALHRGAKGDGFVGVHAFVRFLAVKVFLQQGLDLGDPGAAAHQDDLVDLGFLHPSVLHGFLYRAHGFPEQVVVQFLEPRSGQGFGEIHAVKQRLDLHPYLVLVGKRPLGAFGFATKLLHGLDVA
mmetsp:Transcript_10106/g.33448  ORF Transcript_10106/g.33448 Transcript_10106/m.33448 type:complete len:183 (-) Transcript_10106:906-1454(-)